MHSKNVMHRDLKPGNIMVRDKKILKICDFGCARTGNEVLNRKSNPEDEDSDEAIPSPSLVKGFSTRGIGTDLYKAPELNSGDYDEKVDIWSVGCILMEFLALPKFLFEQDF